jgi:hypothetical protein
MLPLRRSRNPAREQYLEITKFSYFTHRFSGRLENLNLVIALILCFVRANYIYKVSSQTSSEKSEISMSILSLIPLAPLKKVEQDSKSPFLRGI